MANKEEKQYGLILPKKEKPVAPKLSNVFGDDNVSDEEEGTDWVKRALKAEGEKNKMKRQTKLNMQRALKEDPTIYQYDEVYEDMERTRNQAKPTQVVEKKPKYIQNLLKAAERRKKEQEHRIERMVQKEREAEGSMYADKDSFVTSAYRAKLEEFKKMEEEDARMSRLEAIGDVTKQQDISGFYRHLYEQTVENKGQEEKTTENTNQDNSAKKKASDSEDSADNTSHKIKNDSIGMQISKTKKHRQYRQRKVDKNESDSEPEVPSEPKTGDKTETKENSDSSEAKNDKDNNKDYNKDNAEDNTTDVESEGPSKKKLKTTEGLNLNDQPNKDSKENCDSAKVQSNKENVPESGTQKDEDSVKDTVKIVQDRSAIWKKRTVGPVFEAALERYYARKAMRMSAA